MASVYKSLSKRKSPSQKQNEDSGGSDQDIAMEDQLDDSEDTSESEEEDDGQTTQNAKQGTDAGTKHASQPAGFMPKTRVLMLTSRGVTHRWVACTLWMLINLRLIADIQILRDLDIDTFFLILPPFCRIRIRRPN